MTKVYQEENSTFSADGRTYDLNQLWRDVANLPIHQIKISELVWVLKHLDETQDQTRIDRTDLTAPLLVTHYQGKELVVDGLHRLLKAVRTGVISLPYRRIMADVMKRSEVNVALEHKPGYCEW